MVGSLYLRTLDVQTVNACFIADAQTEILRNFAFWTDYRLSGMYGPPPCCKRKVKMTVGSAQMYPVFD
jgi:hypothetical protein